MTVSSRAYEVPWWLTLLVFGGGLLLAHLVRAMRTGPAQAQEWLRQRGLRADARSAEAARRYLRRLRWSRVTVTGVLVAVCAVTVGLTRNWISFASLPFLLSVLLAEASAPAPRRGRIRTALLQRRPRSYFAPRAALTVARVSIGAGAALSLIAAAHHSRLPGSPLLHAAVLLAGGCALETCLRVVSLRPLPDRQPDLSVDVAMRVASARTATAAGLLFGVFGLAVACAYARLAPGPGTAGGHVIGQVVTFGVLAAVVTAVLLLQPVRSWRPRGSA